MARRSRTLTPGRLALRQLRARSATYVPTGVGLVAALALAVAVTLTQARAEDASLVQTVSNLGTHGLVSVRLTGVRQNDAYERFQSDVQRAVQQQEGLVTTRAIVLYADPFTPRTINGVAVEQLGPIYAANVIPLQVASMDDLQSHVALVSGSWPVHPTTGQTIEVTLPENAAAAARLRLGDTQCMGMLPPFTYLLCVHVSGIWRPLDLTAPYWGQEGRPLVAGYTDAATFFSIVQAEQARDVYPQLASVATVTLGPNLNAIRDAGPDAALERMRRLHADFGVARPDAVVVSYLESALDQYVTERSIAAFPIQLVAAQLLLIALYSVWFLTGALLVERRQVIAVWRSRGWSWWGVTRLLWYELFVVAAVATPIGVAAGWQASGLIARLVYSGQAIPTFRFDLIKLATPITAMVVAELGLLAGQAMLAARHGVLRTRSETSRPAAPLWRRRFVDVVLALLAVPLLVQVSLLGSASVRAAGAVSNPIVLVLPGLAIAFLALAALRLLPVAAAVLARVPRSASARLASVQLLRAPGQHGGLAILLMVTVALGVFASAYVSTTRRNQADRAAYQVGADVRATFSGALPALPDQVPLAGAAVRSSVMRAYARTGGDEFQMLAVDPYTFNPVMFTRDDLASSPLPVLVQRLADQETGGLAMPTGTTQVSLWVHGSKTGGSLVAHFSDVHGHPLHADFGSLDFTGWKQLTAELQADGVPSSPPLRFRDFAISDVTAAGEVGFSDFAAGNTLLETFAEDLPPFADQRLTQVLWWRTEWDTGTFAEALAPSLDFPRVTGDRRTVHFRVVPAHIPTFFRPPWAEPDIRMFQPPPTSNTPNPPPNQFPQVPAAGPIPVIVSSGLISRFGLALGKQMQVEVDKVGFTAKIAGVVEYFPTLYPELGDFMVLAQSPLLITLAYGGVQRPWPDEIWARSAAGATDSLVASMRKAPAVVDVLDRREVEAATARNPHALELLSILLLGFLAAMALGVLSLALHFLVLGRGRLADYAVLEANGMPQSVIRRSLLLEELLLLIFCIACATALGVAASVAVLPGLQLGGSPADNAPPTILTFDSTLLSALLVSIAAVSALAAAIIAAAVDRPRIMTELRALG